MKGWRVIIVLACMNCAIAAQQNPFTTINNVRNQVRSATDAVDQRRSDTMKGASAGGGPVSQRIPAGTTRPSSPAIKAPAQPASKVSPIATTKTFVRTGKRDPFESIIRTQPRAGAGCSTGKQCLVVGQIELKGIVRSPDGMIAVVENGERKTYFLHEKDPVFNGQVIKIEPDAIVFRETVVDRAGRQSSRSVVKRLTTSTQIG